MSRSLPASLGVFLGFAVSAFSAEATRVDFNRDVQPILSDKCFQCHGPDEESRKAKLRLDLRESAIDHGAIVPGEASASELVARLFSEDGDEVMPPPKVKKPISEREREILKQWIDEGAEYSGHWSFQPVSEAAPPAVENRAWSRNGIDPFILARLEREGLAPSPEAEAATLARRMSIDLVGLLPSPDQVKRFGEAFEKDADAAVEALADELLASPHYGERWGRHWLDQARYADSNGYTIDGERIMWPYRDWVIRSINDDMPFDQFTIEQIAGDLLPNPSKSQLVASGFHRNTLINQEGGTDDEQFRNEEVVDRVNTTGAVWLGLTLGCAQCHTHKFDPISQREYFELFAFFNQGEDVNNTGPTLEVSEGEMFLDDPDPVLLSALEDARKALTTLERSKTERQKAWEDAWRKKGSRGDDDEKATASPKWTRLKPTSFSAEGGAPLSLLEDDSILAGEGAPRETYRVILPLLQEKVAALRLRLIPHESLPRKGPGRAGNGNIVLTRVEIFQGGKPVRVASAQHDHAQPGAFSAANTIDGNPETGWAINVGKGTPAGVAMNAEHEARYLLERPLVPGGGPIEVVLRHEKNDHYNIGRFALESSPVAPKPIADEKLTSALEVDPSERTPEQKKFLAAEFEKVDTELHAGRATLAESRASLGLGKTVKTMVMRDRDTPRETFIHLRGDFLRHDTEVGPLQAGVPVVLPALPVSETSGASRNRVDLARWLVREDHPLTPRVTVNRVWMRYFGKGIVETENDFGTQGAFPTHPELLDWLARKFVADGWSMKKLHRLIVSSATYRQASVSRPDLVKSDPLNHWWGRQNRLRVDAEIVRDAALSASGLISRRIGGAGVMPPQPDGVYAFTQRKVSWVAAAGEDRYRRAIYTKFYRSAPYPLLTTFDSPDFQSACTSRVRSNTPLQSLTLANDESLFELAQGLGSRLMKEVKGTDSVSNRNRIRHAFLVCFSRQPSDTEVEAVAAFQERQKDVFRVDDAAAAAVAPKEWTSDHGFDVATAASWTAVARALMNTDEFITRE